MFDFSKYNLGELNAINDILDYIDHGGFIDYQMHKCTEEIENRLLVQAMTAGAPPAIQCSNIDKCGVCLTECPMLEEDLH